MLWNNLRTKVREAILAGIGDALAEVESNGTEDTTGALQLLRPRRQPALPAPESNGQTAASTRVRKNNE